MKYRTSKKSQSNINNDRYDDMKNFLNMSRLITEQEEVEVDIDVKKEEEEKTEEYTVSGGKIIVHGTTRQELELTDDEKSAFQETMDEFVEEVSDMAEFGPLHIYPNNVEWSGDLLKYDVRFYYSVDEVDGVYIGNANIIKIDDSFLELLSNLKDFYYKFEAKWAKQLSVRRKTQN